MSSNASPSPGSSEYFPPQSNWVRASQSWRSWPIEVFLPLSVAVLIAATVAPLMQLILGEHFGLTDGRESPSVIGLAFMILAGCWVTRLLDRLQLPRGIATVASIILWFLSFSVWFSLQPHYAYRALLRDPASLVESRGYFILPLFISLAAWWFGTRYTIDPGHFMPEEVRGTVQRSWLLLTISIVLSAMVGGDSGGDAIRIATIAVPVAMIASVALVAGSEIEGTRQLAKRRGGQVPGWKRWYRLVGGFAAGILAISLIVLLLLGPGTMRAFLDGIIFGLRNIGWLAGYILYAIFYVFYLVFRAVVWLIEWIFGDIFGPVEIPKMDGAPPGQQEQLVQQQEPEPFAHATLLKWIAVGIALVIVGFIIFRVTRRPQAIADDGVVEEERASVFSGDLARKQLRDLFRRRPGSVAPTLLDLDRSPKDAREAMLYLEVLANREGVGRREVETPSDFVYRLRGVWQGTGGALADLVRSYHRVRYGDELATRDDASKDEAVVAWSDIWRQRKSAQMPPDN